MTPKIGIPVSSSKTQYYLNQAYVNYVVEAGFHPVAIYPYRRHAVSEVVEECDGLLLPGGIDLDPIYYGEDNSNSMSVDPEKDDFERTMFHAFRNAGKPIFGICRGFQLIVREYLASFGNMEEDGVAEFLEHVGRHQQTTEQNLSRSIHQHWVNYLARGLYGAGPEEIQSMPVNSMHHQCLVVNFGSVKVKEGNKTEEHMVVTYGNFNMLAWTSRGLKDDAKTPYRVICEAVSIDDWGAPILAVQWHPEELQDVDLLRNFFDAYTKDEGAAGAVA